MEQELLEINPNDLYALEEGEIEWLLNGRHAKIRVYKDMEDYLKKEDWTPYIKPDWSYAYAHKYEVTYLQPIQSDQELTKE